MKRLGRSTFLGAVMGVAAMTFAVQANAIELTPYGSIKLATWYNQAESFKAGTGTSYTDRDLSQDILGNSLFGLLDVRRLGFWCLYGSGRQGTKPYVFRTLQAWDQDGGMNG